jgi:hypothetical protein
MWAFRPARGTCARRTSRWVTSRTSPAGLRGPPPLAVEYVDTGQDEAGDELIAPGILRNPVLVEALFDRDAAHEATLRNLLQRRGYESLDDVRKEGEKEGRTEGALEGRRHAFFAVLSARGLVLTAEQRRFVLDSTDPGELDRWIARAATAESTAVVFTTSRARESAASKKRRKPRVK